MQHGWLPDDRAASATIGACTRRRQNSRHKRGAESGQGWTGQGPVKVPGRVMDTGSDRCATSRNSLMRAASSGRVASQPIGRSPFSGSTSSMATNGAGAPTTSRSGRRCHSDPGLCTTSASAGCSEKADTSRPVRLSSTKIDREVKFSVATRASRDVATTPASTP